MATACMNLSALSWGFYLVPAVEALPILPYALVARDAFSVQRVSSTCRTVTDRQNIALETKTVSTGRKFQARFVASKMLTFSSPVVYFATSSSSGESSDAEQKSVNGNAEQKGQGNFWKGLWVAYNKELQEKPIWTKSWTSAVVFILSDLTSQHLEKKTDSPDWARVIRIGLWALLYNGPVLHAWFLFLQRLIQSTSPQAVVAKTLIDQFGMGPVYLSCFFCYMGLVQGESKNLILARIQRDMLPTLKAGWFYWIPAQLINFKFVPSNLNVLYQNAAAYFWNVYLCSVGAKSMDEEQETESDDAKEGAAGHIQEDVKAGIAP
eukprot:CAMPEP_0184336122 /NCGR_PEP_ID=MMETSP1089-20130417/4537_1 /TAXON_ID=38269 ORGANISM="Gloeochaete wittrockiana, Strain SAG46.84" /NCGR_SAMPLE_ID=MMETSP1089 /ASSEMBLY_ACC=CAM_ASM_000445 /LENGTH=321 /DNA_ID=CAMNT_0026661065 /DNA_START=15 /DNA_END=980 /DNA_ORIENTATION=+